MNETMRHTTAARDQASGALRKARRISNILERAYRERGMVREEELQQSDGRAVIRLRDSFQKRYIEIVVQQNGQHSIVGLEGSGWIGVYAHVEEQLRK